MVKSLLISFVLLLPCGFSQASESGPVSPEFKKANQLYASQRFREALSLYQRLLISPPAGISAGDIQARIGDTHFQMGAFQSSLDAYRKAINGQKESARPETQYWIGFCCFLLGRDAEAVGEFLKIPEQYPSSGMWGGTAYYWAGRASERLGKAEDAAAYYRKAGGKGNSTQGKFAKKRAEEAKEKKHQIPSSK